MTSGAGVQPHVVVPEGFADPCRPSGGNVFDRRLVEELRRQGRQVVVHEAAGRWPTPGRVAVESLADEVARIPDGSVVLVDGLVASAVPEVLSPAGRRLRLVVLVHLPLGVGGPEGDPPPGAREREAAVLAACSGVLTTSRWARGLLLDSYDLAPERVRVAEPGVDPAPLAAGPPGALLCVGAVIPGKGHDVLVRALAALTDLDWTCTCVGTLERDAAFVAEVRGLAEAGGVADRVHLRGALTGRPLDEAFAWAGLLVHPTRGETFGMVLTEALARGLPVVASAVGGVPEAVGRSADGRRPGLLVPPGDPALLADALRRWLARSDVRGRLGGAARERRTTLPGWDATAREVGGLLDDVAGH
ncbi:MAG: glycosyltransferase family 4 protein [Nocardioidaceae bacterium]